MNKVLLQGMINGLKEMGATFQFFDSEFIYFNVKKGSEIDNEEKLQRAKEAFQKTFNLGLKIRKID